MSGHSHWAGIKHKKAANDAKRGKLWSKLARNIIATTKQAGPDPDQNLALRYAIEKAKAANMPKDTIEKAIKKGSGNLDGVNYENVLYEGYGNNGVAVMCAALTDNRNRTAAELRKIFEKTGGALGQSGCVAWIFSQKGIITVEQEGVDEAELMEIAIDAGADDFIKEADTYDITCPIEAFDNIKRALIQKEFPIQQSEISQLPSTLVKLDEKGTKKILDLLERLDDQDDVQNVYANYEVPDDLLEKPT